LQEKDSLRKKFFGLFRRYRVMILFITVILIIIIWALSGEKGFISRKKLERENAKLMEQYREDSSKSVSLEKEIEMLNKSDKKLEEVAREKFGMTKAGEKIYKIIIDSTNK